MEGGVKGLERSLRSKNGRGDDDTEDPDFPGTNCFQTVRWLSSGFQSWSSSGDMVHVVAMGVIANEELVWVPLEPNRSRGTCTNGCIGWVLYIDVVEFGVKSKIVTQKRYERVWRDSYDVDR